MQRAGMQRYAAKLKRHTALRPERLEQLGQKAPPVPKERLEPRGLKEPPERLEPKAPPVPPEQKERLDRRAAKG